LTFDSPRFGYYEYSALPGSDVNDEKAWAQANPAMGYTITKENIRDASIFDSKDAFRTETLCMFIDAIENVCEQIGHKSFKFCISLCCLLYLNQKPL
jgi:hypothetical protein